ncbi:hypothetical protein IJT10_05755 [bacterium]|nr:hypothetical protein [bacterium]
MLPVSYWVIAFILAFLRTGSLYFYNGEKSIATSAPYVYILVSLTCFLFYAFIFAVLIFSLHAIFTRFTDKLFDHTVTSNGQSNWLAYVILFFGWLPNLIIRYPGAICFDTWRVLHIYAQRRILDSQNGVLYSLIMGKCLQFFEQMDHINWGLWFVVVVQYLLAVFVFGYSIQLFQRMKIRREIVGLIVIFYLLCPCIIGYFGVATKDEPYSVLMFFLTILLMEFSIDPSEFCNSKLRLFFLYFSVSGVCLLRKNGIYVVGLSSLFFVPTVVRERGAKQFLIPFIVIVVSCLSIFPVKGFISCRYRVGFNSVRESLSLPFQQTARYVKYHRKDVTNEERRVIDDVLGYKTLAKRYNPKTSDPVKGGYREHNEKLPAYFKVWIKQFFRHPFCYLAATWEQNYYLFVPEAEWDNITLFLDCDTIYKEGETFFLPKRWKKFHKRVFYKPPVLKSWKEWAISKYYQLHKQIPIGMMSNVSVNTYSLFLLFSLMFIERKRWQYVFPLMLLTVLCVVLGPAIQGHPRYMFPVIYSMPSLIVYTMFSFRREPTEVCQEVTINEVEDDRSNEEIH